MRKYIFIFLLLILTGAAYAQYPGQVYYTNTADENFIFSIPAYATLYNREDSSFYHVKVAQTTSDNLTGALAGAEVYKVPKGEEGGSSPPTVTNPIWEQAVSNNDDNNWTVTFTIVPTAIIMYNGIRIRSSEWSGDGTTTLTLAFPTYKHDEIIVQNN